MHVIVIIHSFVDAGLTRGSVPLSFLQWFGRSNVLFLILHSIPEVSFLVVKNALSSADMQVDTVLEVSSCSACLSNAHTHFVSHPALDTLGSPSVIRCMGCGRCMQIPMVCCSPNSHAAKATHMAKVTLLDPSRFSTCHASSHDIDNNAES